MQHETVREILREAVEVTKELPAELRSVAFDKVLDLLASGVSTQEEGSPTSKAPETPRDEQPKKKEALAKTARKSRNGTGPKPATLQALESGFFDQPQTIETLARHLKQDLVLTFTSQLLGTVLARLVREGRLGRKQNQEGRYEYYKI
jgi:hypothetical protein